MKMIAKRSFLLILMILFCFSSSVVAEIERFSVTLMEEIFFPLPEPIVNHGKDASFGVMVYHDGCTFQWYSEEGVLHDNDNVRGSTTDTLTLLSVDCGDNGKRFRCEVTDGDTVVFTEWMVLTVNHVFDCKDQNEKALIKKATCKEEGICYYSCACGKLADRIFYIDTIPHHGGVATCKSRAICEDCGETYGNLAPHEPSEWEYNKDLHWKQCPVCLEKHGEAAHVPGEDATCLEPQICEICSGVVTLPLGHSFTEYQSNQDATCLLDGTETAVCDRCDVTDTRIEKGSALGHSFTHYVFQNDSTCFSDGSEMAVCDRCDVTDTRIKENSKIPHSPQGSWYHNETEHWQCCGVCFEKVSVGYHVADGDATETEASYCMVCQRELAAAIGHVHKLTEIKGSDPTCTEPGMKTYYTCICGNRYLDSSALIPVEDPKELDLAPLGHIGGEATCISLAVCSRCSEPYGDFADHGFSLKKHDQVAHWMECLVCGERKDEERHYGGESFCFKQAACDVCGTFYGGLLEHSYKIRFNDTVHWLECEFCRITTEPENHAGGWATCTEKAHCEVCDKEYGKTMDHIFDQKVEDDIYRFTKADCIGSALYYYSCVCGEKGEDFFAYGDPLPHSYDGFGYNDEVHYLQCSSCGRKDMTESHVWIRSEASSLYEEIFECKCGAKRYHYSLPFQDVNEDDWFHDDVVYVYHHGLLRGMKDDTFGPDTETSRAMIVTILHRMEGEPQIGTDTFDDVSETDWYGAAVLWAAEVGVVNGYGNGLFGPDDEVTREQIAAILYRYAQYKEYDVSDSADLTSFPDQNTVSNWAEESLCWAVGEGLINGVFENGLVFLKPQDNALRCQIAAILHRYQLLHN